MKLYSLIAWDKMGIVGVSQLCVTEELAQAEEPEARKALGILADRVWYKVQVFDYEPEPEQQ